MLTKKTNSSYQLVLPSSTTCYIPISINQHSGNVNYTPILYQKEIASSVVVEARQAEAKAKAKAKSIFRGQGQGQGQPFRGRGGSRPRPHLIEAKAKNEAKNEAKTFF